MSNIQIIKKEVKNITLKVKPSCEVILTIPITTDQEYIDYILKKRKSWIDQKIEFFKSNNKPQYKEYVSGESFEYLGKRYRLKVIEANEEQVKLQRGYIQIFIKQYSHIINKEIKTIRIRQMKTRWGSCNPSKGYINLNTELIKKPKYCIEYVIFHELAHLVHPNHSRSFYNYLNRKDRLEHSYH